MNEMRIRSAAFEFFNLDFITVDRFEVIIADKRMFLRERGAGIMSHKYYILENGAKSVIFYPFLNIIFGDTYVYAAG